jgi:hypothetical protein
MSITEAIRQHVQRLPASLQAEVLDFVEYLLAKTERREAREWSDLSLAFAMRGMEGEEIPTYTAADLKVVFA